MIFVLGSHDPLSALLLCGADRADRVMVAGQWRVVDGAVVGLDLPQLIIAHRAAAARLMDPAPDRPGDRAVRQRHLVLPAGGHRRGDHHHRADPAAGGRDLGRGPVIAFPTPFAFGLPTFHVAAIISRLIVILVTLTETTADILAVGEIVGTKVDRKRIAAGLRAEMASNAVSPVSGSFTQNAFAQNVGLVAITTVRSR
jgi:hypothetical protein